MASIVNHEATLANADHHEGPLHHQFEDIEQQNESYIVGMWTFLVTEVMFFGVLFLIYILFRWKYQPTFWEAGDTLNVGLGALNTTVLLISSFTMVMAVHFAQLKKTKAVIMNLGATIGCAFIFLLVKAFEYKEKFEHHHFPGYGFQWHGKGNPNEAQLFFSIYFTMTGLHAIHIIIGIAVLGALGFMHFKKNPLVVEDFVPTEMVGLYWHFVDLVWIFLFPLYYLLPK